MICGCSAPYVISDQKTIFKAPPILRFTEDELIVLLIVVPCFGKLGGFAKVEGVEVNFDVSSICFGLLASPDCFLLVKSSSSILEGLSRAGRQIG